MASYIAKTDLSWNGKKFPAGREFDDKGLPQAVVEQWELDRLISPVAATPKAPQGKPMKEASNGS